MSILTGEAKGKVTLIAGTSIVVIERARIYTIDIRTAYAIVCGMLGASTIIVLAHPLISVVKVGQIDAAIDRSIPPDELREIAKAWTLEMFDAIVGEDVDIVWLYLQEANEWTRTPDREPLRARI